MPATAAGRRCGPEAASATRSSWPQATPGFRNDSASDNAGNILLVHADPIVEKADQSIGLRFLDIQYYVSSVSADGTRQCTDTRLPDSCVGSPRALLIGSELIVVDQVVQSPASVVTVIRRYEVDASTCNGEVR